MLWLRTLLFTLLVPGTVLVLVPLALLGSGLGARLDWGWAHSLKCVAYFQSIRLPKLFVICLLLRLCQGTLRHET